MPRLYVAGSSSEIPRARHAMAAARSLGFTVTADWTKTIDEAGGIANPIDATDNDCRGWAREDLDGVGSADYLLLLFPDRSPGRGAFVEFGYALAMDLFTVVAGAEHRHSIFSFLADGLADTDEIGLALLVCEAERRRARIDSLKGYL